MVWSLKILWQCKVSANFFHHFSLAKPNLVKSEPCSTLKYAVQCLDRHKLGSYTPPRRLQLIWILKCLFRLAVTCWNLPECSLCCCYTERFPFARTLVMQSRIVPKNKSGQTNWWTMINGVANFSNTNRELPAVTVITGVLCILMRSKGQFLQPWEPN